MSKTCQSIDSGIEHFQALVQQSAELREEFAGSLSQFFKSGLPDPSNPLKAIASARRHLEWFLFERHSPSLRNRPVEGLLSDWQAAYSDRAAELDASLLQSFSGLFEIVTIESGTGARAVDLSGLRSYTLSVEDDQFEVGDLLVGRLFPIEDEYFLPSTACASIRDARVLSAVKRDVDAIREAQERKVFRIAQEELEGMFFVNASVPVGPVESVGRGNAVANARDWLTGAGIAPDAIEAILSDFRENAPDPDNIHPGRGDVLGHWLDELAFASAIDLEAARATLLGAWFELHLEPKADAASNSATEGEPDVSSAIAEFERDCASGKAVSEALNDLERRLALDLDESGDPGTVPDFPGVVGAMVEEFLWEEESEHGTESVAGFAVLHAFSSYSKDLGVFEELSLKDVADFATRWLPENPKACAHSQAPVLLKALGKFCVWAVETQGALNLAEASTLLRDLAGTLERILRIDEAFGDNNEGELFEITELETNAIQLANFETGDEGNIANTSSLNELEVGDLLRARRDDDGLSAVRVYPKQLGSLLRDLAGA